MKKKYITPQIITTQLAVQSNMLAVSFNGETPLEGDGTDMNSNSIDRTLDEDWM